MRTIVDQREGRLLQGRYRLEAELGAGSSARVYLADDTRLDRPVAVKILHPALSGDQTFVRRFRLEARAAAMLNHPNIVHVYDWGNDDEGLYVVLEYLAGGSLRDVLRRRGTISVPQAASIGLSIARALAFAHDRGFVHRDIKPANLLFDESGIIHLADFGLTRALSDASWAEPRGIVLGTARYASPEQALGQRVDDRSDVYSLGLVLFEAVTGRAPFVGDTTYSLLIGRVGKALPSAPELGPLESYLDEATRADPYLRLRAAELAAGLDRVIHELPTPETVLLDAPVEVASSTRGGDELDDTTRIAFSLDEADATILGAGNGPIGRDENVEAHRFDLREGADPPSSVRRQRRHPRRRRRLRVAFVSAAVVASGAVGALAITRYVIFDRVVPNVLHDQLSAARRDVVGRGLKLRVEKKSFSSIVPIGAVMSESPSPGVRERAGVDVTVIVSRGPATVPVPRLLGDSKTEAVGVLTRDHLVPVLATTYSEAVPVGKVVGASPSTRTARYGTRVNISISAGPHPRTIPRFPSSTFDAANARLASLRLVPVERLVYSNDVQSGFVISTSPPGGTPGVAVGSRVEVTVSKGPHLVAVPSVTNLSISAAIARLQAAGLTVNEQIGPPFSTKATTTNPRPGSEVRIGTPVTLYVA